MPETPADPAAPRSPGTAAVLDAFGALLAPCLRYEFALDGFDVTGVPVWSTWCAELGSSYGGIGYGATPDRARVGALGETVEHTLALRRLAGAEPVERVEGSYRELVAARGATGVADPRSLGLPAGADYDEDRPLQWLPMRRLPRGAAGADALEQGLDRCQEVLVPAEFVASGGDELPTGRQPAPAAGWLTTPVTNGLGAGSSLGQATAHAVLEILQRDGNGLTFRAFDRGVTLDVAARSDGADAPADEQTRAVLARLAAAGVEVLCKLGATDFGLPNVYVVGTAPGDDLVTATACGEAVHPDREVALRKAVLEFASARARKRFMHGPLDAVAALAPAGYLDEVLPGIDPGADEQRVLRATVDWLATPEDDWRPLLERTVLSRRSSVPLGHLPTSDVAPADMLRDVLRRLGDQGFDVLVADFSAEGSGVHGVKALVPGLEVETVAYGRLGERNAFRWIKDGRDDLVRVGDRPDGAGWARIHLTDEGVERLGGPAWLGSTALDRAVGPLLPLYREPTRHAAQLATAPARGGS